MNRPILRKTIMISTILLLIGNGLSPLLANTIDPSVSNDSYFFSEINNSLGDIFLDNSIFHESHSQINEKIDYAQGELIIKFRSDVKITNSGSSDEFVKTSFVSIDSLNQKYQMTSLKPVFESGKKNIEKSTKFSNIFKAKFSSEDDITRVIEEYSKLGEIEYIEPNYMMHICMYPNDPLLDQQWGLGDIDAFNAWDIETGNSEIVVCVIDTGVDYNHPDLAGNIWNNPNEIPDNGIDDDDNGYVDDYYGWDFINDDNDPIDDSGHGTHCAGVIGAVGNNNIGITGLCWNCKLMLVKFLSNYGGGTAPDAANSIIYAADNGADVISNSWGSAFDSQLIRDAVEYANSKGVIQIGATGNSNTDNRFYPAAYDQVISISAIDVNDHKADFSNYGSWVDIAAPGVSIFSTMPTYQVHLNNLGYTQDYSNMSGTSMACPHVSGLAALILSKNPSFDEEDILTILHSTVEEVNSDKYIGLGRINAYNSIQKNSITIAKINSDLDDITARGIISINGTAASAEFYNYKLSYGYGVYPASLNEIYNSYSPVENDVMTTWDTNSVEDGDITLKLEVTNLAGETSQDVVVINVDNIYLTCPFNNDIFRAGDTIEIKGTVLGSNFDYYNIYWRDIDDPDQWFTDGISLVDNGQSEIIDDTLGYFDTSCILDGVYITIKIVANFGNLQKLHFINNIYIDPTLKQGWPKSINWDIFYDEESDQEFWIWGGFLEPVVSDINNDGNKEIIIFQGGNPPKLHVFNLDGSLCWTTSVGNVLCYTRYIIPIVGDINNDDFNEIIVLRPRQNNPFDSTQYPARLFAYDHLGNELWSTEVVTGFYATMILADLDLDGSKEIIIKDCYGGNSKIVIVDSIGEIINQWDLDSIHWGGSIVSSPAIGNFDDDPELELVCASPSADAGYDWDEGEWINEGVIHVYNMDGSDVAGWPIYTNGTILSSPAVGDINNDGDLEIIVGLMFAGKPDYRYGGVYVFDKTGGILPGWPFNKGYKFWSSPSLADFDNDGDLEIAISRLGNVDIGFETFVIHHDGTMADGWPQNTAWADWYSTVIADINGDGVPDIITSAGQGFYPSISNHGGVYAWNFDGTLIEGFPKITENDAQAPVVVDDIDNDGIVEIIASSDYDFDIDAGFLKGRGTIYIWETTGNYNEDTMEWPTFHCDIHRTGLYKKRDNTPPVTKYELSKPDGNNGWYIISATLFLFPEDDLSGVKKTMYKIDNGKWQVYYRPIKITGDEMHNVQFYSVDNDLNIEEINQINVNIDGRPPITKAILPEPDYLIEGTPVYVRPVTVKLSSKDDPSGVEYTKYKVIKNEISTDFWHTYDKPFYVSENGEYTVQFYSVDIAGNVEDVEDVSFIVYIRSGINDMKR